MAKKAQVIVDTSMGDAQDKKVQALAVLIDEGVMPVVAELAHHKREYQGGPFVVMHKVTTWLASKGYNLAELPDPKSRAGNNPAHYKARRYNGTTERIVDAYFYDDIADKLPSVIGMRKRIDVLNRALSNKENVKRDDIPEADTKKPPHILMGEVKRLTAEIGVAKSNIASSFELFWQLREFGDLDKVNVQVSFQLEDDGVHLKDGREGREFAVEKINDPITIRSRIAGREDIDKRRLGVASFCNIDVAKAKEAVGGATFHALINTLKKEPTQDQPVTGNVNINTVETFFTVETSAVEYLQRIQETETSKASWSTIMKDIEKDDEKFYLLWYHFESLRSLVGNPRDAIRGQNLANQYAGKLPIKKAA